MSRLNVGRTFGVASFAVLTSVSGPSASRAPDVRAGGYTFELATKAVSSTAVGGPASGFTASGMVGPDGAVRLDITALEGGSMSAVGDYYFVKAGKSLLVRPGSKTFVDIGDPPVSPEMTVSSITAASEKIPGTEPIEGRPTEHVRTTVAYTTGISGQSIPTTVVTDYWLVKLSIPIVNPMAAVKNVNNSGPLAELVKKQLEVAPNAAAGVAVKAVITTTRSAMGRSASTTVTTEMKNLKQANVDVAKIVMPDGYTKALR